MGNMKGRSHLKILSDARRWGKLEGNGGGVIEVKTCKIQETDKKTFISSKHALFVPRSVQSLQKLCSAS